jgi:hypothetical protein
VNMALIEKRTISAVEINLVLSSADELSRNSDLDLVSKYPEWDKQIDYLNADSCPVTYLPVTAVLLIARALRSPEHLNVLHIQTKTSEQGYSAPSLGKLLISFAVQQKIDLRSTSSQIMNNQPFTFKAKIEPDMASSHKATQYSQFFKFANYVNEISSTTALEILGLMFSKCRFDALPDVKINNTGNGLASLMAMGDLASNFVDTNSESGKVGQAFVAALFDLAFPGFENRMGNNNDPSVYLPGDVQSEKDGSYWIWAEVKQKSVVTPDIQTFLERISEIKGDRAMYFALANEPYPQNLNLDKLQKEAMKKGVLLHVFTSPAQAFREVTSFAPGSAIDLANRFANTFNSRLREAAVTNELRNKWIEIASNG